MPRGYYERKNKRNVVNDAPNIEQLGEFSSAVEQKEEPKIVQAKEPVLTGDAAQIAESRKVLKFPIGSEQCFFESPEGYIVLGEKDRGRVWCRQANGGRGMWINKMR